MEYCPQRRLSRWLTHFVDSCSFLQISLRFALLLSILLLVAAPSFCANPPRPVKVLVLYFADKDGPGVDVFLGALRTKMERELNRPVWIYEESFDESWLGRDSVYERTLETFLQHKYAKRGIDLVMPMGDLPVEFMQKRRKTLLPDAKLIYFAMGHSPRVTTEATGLAWKFNLAPTLDIALLQNPTAHHVLLLSGASAVDRAWGQLFLSSGLQYLRQKQSKVDLRILPAETIDQTCSRLAALPQDTITIFLSYFGDSAGQGFVPARILRTLSAVTNRPMYSWLGSYLGRGIVGGSLAKNEAIGEALGSIAVRVLRGEKPSSIPELSFDFQQYEFDAQQMERWGIRMDTLPAESRVINRQYTVWELYKWRIIGIIALVLVELAFIVALIRFSIAQKRHLEQLAYQRSLETLIAEVAAALVDLRAEPIYAAIEWSFERMLGFFDLDRIALFEFSIGTAQLRLLCFRAATGVAQSPPFLDLHHLPWTTSQLMRGNAIVISHLSDLPEEASELREVLRAHGVRSYVAFPLQRNANTFAALSFSAVRTERRWEHDRLQSLRTIADILGNALERKEAEEAMRESEGRFRLVANTAPMLIWMSGPDKLCTYFNQAWLDFTGRLLEAEIGNGWLEGVYPDDFEKCLETYTRAFDRRQPFRMEYRLRGHDGQFRWILDIGIPRINTDGTFAGYIGSCVDVNERKRVEQALIQSEQLKASILDSLGNYIVVVDSHGIVVAVNYLKFDSAAGNSLLGFRVGTNYFEICRRTIGDNPELTMALEGIRSVFDGRRDYFELELALPSATEPTSLLMSVTPLKGPDRGIVISHHDITERKRHEEAIQDLSGRLINAQEQERSRIARELHDDINQQLAVLAIELQQLQDLFPEDYLHGRQQVQALWKKTLGLSTDLQHLSHQLHSTKLEHLGITAALRGLCGEFSEQHKIGADFNFRHVPPKLDSEISLHLFRVAQESLHNVAKHSRAKKVHLELVGTDGKVVLRVSDDGVGFDPDAVRNNTGLGMTSMSERIRFVGGVLSIWSRPSMGTQVEATIPLSGRPVTVNRTSESAAHNIRAAGD
jgi:PAS domain S-box-containing protein